MALDSKTKELLDKFAETQVALNDRDKPRGSSEIKLGTLLDEAHGALRSAAVTYNALVDGSAIGSYTLDSIAVPAGAIITRGWIAENVNLTSGGAATVDITIGATSLTGGAKAYTVFAGVLESAGATLAATLPEASSGGKVTLTIAGDALTAGELLIVFEYIYPV